jgi:hypothetical protein
MQGAGEPVRRARLLGGREAHAVPGRFAGADLELAETRGGRERGCRILSSASEHLEGRQIEADRRLEGGPASGELGEGPQDVEHRDAERLVAARDGAAVVAQHAAQPHERVVDVGDLGLLGLLVARDRADQVALQIAWRDGEPRESDARQAVPHAFDRRSARADDEHPLAVLHQRADGVDDGLRAARARQGVDGERLPGDDAGEHPLLLGIRIQKEQIGCRCPLIRVRPVRSLPADRQRLAVAVVPGERVEDGVVEIRGVAGHRAADIGEAGHHQARLDRERLDRGGERTQVIDDRLRFEDAALGGERGQSHAVQLDAELRAQRADEFGVDRDRSVELQFEVGVMPADRERPQQHRRRARQSSDAPRREPHAESHGVEPPRGAQLDVLRREALGGDARGAEGDLVAEEVGQQRRAPGDELRKTSGVRLRDLDAGLGEIGVMQQRRRAAQHPDLSAETLALGLCDVHDRHSWFGKAQVTGGHECRGHVVLRAHQGASISSPHTSQRKRRWGCGTDAGPSFAGLATRRLISRSSPGGVRSPSSPPSAAARLRGSPAVRMVA